MLDSVANLCGLGQVNDRSTHFFLAIDSIPEHLQVRYRQVLSASWNLLFQRCDLEALGSVDPASAMFVTSACPAFHCDNGRLIQRRQVGSGWGAASSISTSTFVRI